MVGRQSWKEKGDREKKKGESASAWGGDQTAGDKKRLAVGHAKAKLRRREGKGKKCDRGENEREEERMRGQRYCLFLQ